MNAGRDILDQGSLHSVDSLPSDSSIRALSIQTEYSGSTIFSESAPDQLDVLNEDQLLTFSEKLQNQMSGYLWTIQKKVQPLHYNKMGNPVARTKYQNVLVEQWREVRADKAQMQLHKRERECLCKHSFLFLLPSRVPAHPPSFSIYCLQNIKKTSAMTLTITIPRGVTGKRPPPNREQADVSPPDP